MTEEWGRGGAWDLGVPCQGFECRQDVARGGLEHRLLLLGSRLAPIPAATSRQSDARPLPLLKHAAARPVRRCCRHQWWVRAIQEVIGLAGLVLLRGGPSRRSRERRIPASFHPRSLFSDRRPTSVRWGSSAVRRGHHVANPPENIALAPEGRAGGESSVRRTVMARRPRSLQKWRCQLKPDDVNLRCQLMAIHEPRFAPKRKVFFLAIVHDE